MGCPFLWCIQQSASCRGEQLAEAGRTAPAATQLAEARHSATATSQLVEAGRIAPAATQVAEARHGAPAAISA